MSVAQHAENILSAWIIADQRRFAAELDKALSSCETGKHGPALDAERHELLESIARHFQNLPSDERFCGSGTNATLTLLRHLTNRGAGSEKSSEVITGTSSKETQIRH